MSAEPASRVTDGFGHSSALGGALVGLAIGVGVGLFIIGTGGLGAIAVGAAVGVAGGLGLAGEAIGATMPGPVTGNIQTGSPNVMVNGLPMAAVQIGAGSCSHHAGTQRVASGAATVLINGQPAARIRELMTCSAAIRTGSPNVAIGGPSKQVLQTEPEVPRLLHNTMLAMAIGGAIIGTGGIAATYGTGAAVGSLVGGISGGTLLSAGARQGAAALGFGATGQEVAAQIGGFAGGALFGGMGMRGGQWAQARIPAGRPGSFFSPKNMGATEPGAVPNNPKLQAEMDAGAAGVPGRTHPGYPDLPPDKAATFGDDVRPWNGDTHPGPIRRVIGRAEDANGGFWQPDPPETEAGWRGGSAVLNDWNGNGAYVESPSQGLRGWIGSARPQMSSDGVNVLPGGGTQIWLPPGSANPGPPRPTPWSR